jgi:Holliday junction resolvase-like predicted endonuclease
LNNESELLISLLKLTKDGPVSQELIKKESRLRTDFVDELLRKLQIDGFIYCHAGLVEASSVKRLELAVRALKSGVDVERVSDFLLWKEFEGIAAVAFESNGYVVVRNLHFKHCGHRWEIDIIGCKSSLVVCLDCKQWRHGLHSSAAKIAERQAERTRALVMSLPNPAVKVECFSRGDSKFVPAVLSLTLDRLKFYEGVPIVPVLQLQDFLNQLPVYASSLLCLRASVLKDYQETVFYEVASPRNPLCLPHHLKQRLLCKP